MLILDQNKTVFVFAESTASRSIFEWLIGMEGVERTAKHDHAIAPVRQFWGQEYAGQIKEYTVCFTVRHPFRRLLSMWFRLSQWKNENDGHGIFWNTFGEFMDFLIEGSKIQQRYGERNEFPLWEQYERPFYRPIKQSEIYQDLLIDFGKVDHLIHAECPAFDLEKLPWVRGPIKLPWIGKTEMNLCRFDTPENRTKVKRYCPEEFELLGY